MNCYVIEINGKVALTAQSSKDRQASLQKVALTMNPCAVVRKVKESHFKKLKKTV